MRSLSNTFTHDQHWELNLKFLILCPVPYPLGHILAHSIQPSSPFNKIVMQLPYIGSLILIVHLSGNKLCGFYFFPFVERMKTNLVMIFLKLEYDVSVYTGLFLYMYKMLCFK